MKNKELKEIIFNMIEHGIYLANQKECYTIEDFGVLRSKAYKRYKNKLNKCLEKVENGKR